VDRQRRNLSRYAGELRGILPVALVLCLMTPLVGFSAEPAATTPAVSPAPAESPSTALRSDIPKSLLNWETREGRSYVIPALEIIAYEFALNWYDRNYLDDKQVYRTDGNTFWKHLTDSKWVIDDDQFEVNQFLHPYGGSVYYGLARSAGLNFWESFL
jgi:hypothetical protein